MIRHQSGEPEPPFFKMAAPANKFGSGHKGGSATLRKEGSYGTMRKEGGSTTMRKEGSFVTMRKEGGSATMRKEGGSATMRREGGFATMRREGGSKTMRNEAGSASMQKCKTVKMCIRITTGFGFRFHFSRKKINKMHVIQDSTAGQKQQIACNVVIV